MTRLGILFGCLFLLASPALATSEFGKQWKAEFTDKEVDEDWYKAVRKENCYICHVRGKKKDEARNEYGQSVHKFLKEKDFPKDYVKANPEEAKAKIVAGFKKANELKSKDGKVFGEKIKAKAFPATDAGE